MGEITSFLTTKVNIYFVSFESIKNKSRLHMNMNLGFFSFVDFGVDGIGLMATLFLFQVNI